MNSALGALRRVLRVKIQKAPKPGKKAPQVPAEDKDKPGSEYLKQAYVVMKHVQSMSMGDKLKNLCTAIVGNVGKLAKKKCTMSGMESASSAMQKKSALQCSTYALELLEKLNGRNL